MQDEIISSKEQYYNIKNYKDEIEAFVTQKKSDLSVTSQMKGLYDALYKVVFAGTTDSKDIRFPYASEAYKVYKSALIEACLSGYTALFDTIGGDAEGVLLAPEVKSVMTDQCKQMALLEKLSAETLDDWILKGESVAFIKLKGKREEYRIKETLYDAETGEDVLKFTMKEFVQYDNLDIDRIDPLDFYVDAYDYQDDPRGAAKIIRSWVSAKELLSSDQYPLLTQEDKQAIITSVGKNGTVYTTSQWGAESQNTYHDRETNVKRIEVLTFYGDYVTQDYKVLKNIKATLVHNKIADLKYCDVNTNRIIYAPYKIDENTHRGVCPLACSQNVDTLVNRVTDLFIQNLDNTANPIMLYQKGSMSSIQVKEARNKRQLEYNDVNGAKPEYLAPPAVRPESLQIIDMVLNQGKNVLGLNQYLAGSTDGAVRTARESSIIFQKANARMRVETDVFSYNFMLPLFVSLYAFNRELALVADMPLDPVFANPSMKVLISTNASKADKEGELQRLMQMLQLPIAQMIFSNLTPDQIVLAVRYLMAKADLKDADNLLELVDANGQPNVSGLPPEQQLGGEEGNNQEPSNLQNTNQPDTSNNQQQALQQLAQQIPNLPPRGNGGGI